MRRCSFLMVVIATLLLSANVFAQSDGNFAVAIETNLITPANPLGVDTVLHLSNSGSSWGAVLLSPAGALF